MRSLSRLRASCLLAGALTCIRASGRRRSAGRRLSARLGVLGALLVATAVAAPQTEAAASRPRLLGFAGVALGFALGGVRADAALLGLGGFAPRSGVLLVGRCAFLLGRGAMALGASLVFAGPLGALLAVRPAEQRGNDRDDDDRPDDDGDDRNGAHAVLLLGMAVRSGRYPERALLNRKP